MKGNRTDCLLDKPVVGEHTAPVSRPTPDEHSELCSPNTTTRTRNNHVSPRSCWIKGSALLLLLTLALKLLLPSARPEARQSTATPSFDFYLMAMSYQPQFCYLHRYDNYAGCKTPDDYWKTHWTIHGLWPEYSDGSYPSYCSNTQLNSTVLDPLCSDLELYWPNVKVSNDASCYERSGFWAHEWSTHGTCSGMSPTEYMTSALAYRIPTPDLVAEAYGGEISVQDLQSALVYDTVLICSSGYYLSEIRACMSIDGVQIDCPSFLMEQSSCNQDTLRLATFPSDNW